uniref:Uncharacterized protein n=2 Tax=Sphaerodactylus townsendi TaxID=933632 RepID=A0ACB8FSV6_9SAUR
MALGITQILIGTLEISFGLVVAIAENATRFYSSATHVGTPYWLGILYIISGSLSVAAAKNPKVPLVKGMLAMNVLSSVASGAAVVMRSLVISHSRYSSRCTYVTEIPPDICYEYVTIPYTVTYAISAFLMIGTVLEFLITITTAAFGCASVCRDAYSETTIVIFRQTDEGIIPASALPRQSNEEVPA